MTNGVAAPMRSAQDVIDEAIRANLWWDRLCFVTVAVCLAIGVTLVIIGIMRSSGVFSLSGTGCTAMFWPAMRYAVAIQRDNRRIRMYELALAQASSATEAAKILRDAVGVAPK